LGESGVGANDLLEVWRTGVFNDVQELELSVEHLAFYLASEDAEGLKRPKAWMVSQLRKGYYPAPAGYKSWEERQEEAKLADARNRQERVRELRKQRFEAEFEIWEAGLAEEKRERLTSNCKPGSQVAKSILRAEYAREIGFDLQEE
jgi:hypothetical protein